MGVERALEGIPVAGRTDSIILRDAVRAIDGRELTPELRDAIRDTYMGILREEIDRVGGGPGVLPGVRPLLERLAGDQAYHVALLTGNFSQTAEIKLGYFDLWRHFAWGAFGEDAVHRNDLLPVALARYRERTGQDIAPRGRGRHRRHAQRRGGGAVGQARSVCVTTGQFDRASLLAAGADVVFHDLSDVDEVLRVFAGRAAATGRRRGSQRGPVALPVFKTGGVPPCGTAGFDSQGLPPPRDEGRARCPTRRTGATKKGRHHRDAGLSFARPEGLACAYASSSLTSPARGPLPESSALNSTRCPSRSSSNTAPRTALRWKKCSTPVSSRMNPKPLSMSRRAMVPDGIP